MKLKSVRIDQIGSNGNDSHRVVGGQNGDDNRNDAKSSRGASVSTTYYLSYFGEVESRTYRRFLAIRPSLVPDMLGLVRYLRTIVERYTIAHEKDGQASFRTADISAIVVEVNDFIERHHENVRNTEFADGYTPLTHGIRFWFSHFLPNILQRSFL